MDQVQGAVFKGQSGQSLVSVHLALPPLADDSDKSWVQVIPGEGKFEGHADGPFEFTESTIDTVIANFAKGRTPVKVDYEHDTHKYELLGPKISSGHVLELQKRHGDDGAQLWAYCEWTAKAAEYIRNNEYNFNSPVIAFEWDDAITGEDQGATLLSLALTDTPFLDGQNPVQLSLFTASKAPEAKEAQMADDTEDKAKEMTDGSEEEKPKEMADGSSEEEPKEMAEGEGDAPEPESDAFMDSLMAATGADKAALTAVLTELMDPIAKMAADMLDKDGTPAEMSQTISEAEKVALQADAQGSKLRELSQQVSKLLKESDARAQQEKAKRDADNAETIDKLVKLGRIHEGKRASALKLLSQDPKSFGDIYLSEDAPQVVPLERTQADEAQPDPAAVKFDQLTPPEQQQVNQFVNARVLGGDRNKCIQRVVELRSN